MLLQNSLRREFFLFQGDTPGLADLTMAKQAAEAITSALQDGAREKRNVKIFFVVTETNGRVRPEDLFTIKQVSKIHTVLIGPKQ